MSGTDKIPSDIDRTAFKLAMEARQIVLKGGNEPLLLPSLISDALMAERERCASIAENFRSHGTNERQAIADRIRMEG